MSGVSPQLIDLRKRIAERIEQKKAELPRIDDRLNEAKDHVAELTVKRQGILLGIEQDEALLANAVPKKPRTKKVPGRINPHDEVYYGKGGKVENLENQLSAEKP